MLVKLICKNCGKTYLAEKYRVGKSKYCSRKCTGIARKGVWLNTGRTHFKKGSAGFTGKHTLESNLKNRLAHLGKRNSIATEFKKGQRPWNWAGGSSKERVLVYSEPKHRNWRKQVLWGGGWKCSRCGSKEKIQADHIFPWSTFPKFRTDVNNGQILCKKCHLVKTMKVDKYMPFLFKKIVQNESRFYNKLYVK